MATVIITDEVKALLRREYRIQLGLSPSLLITYVKQPVRCSISSELMCKHTHEVLTQPSSAMLYYYSWISRVVFGEVPARNRPLSQRDALPLGNRTFLSGLAASQSALSSIIIARAKIQVVRDSYR